MSRDTTAVERVDHDPTGVAADPTGSAPSDGRHAARPTSLRRQILGLAVGIAVPTALYYVLHGIGLSNLAALSLAAILPSLSAVYNLVIRRRVDAVALVVLATIVLTVVLSLIARNPRFLLARDGLITGLWGLWFFATLRARRPAAFLFARPLMEGRKVFGTRAWEPLWENSAQFRRIWRFATVVFGAGLVVDAVPRIVMAYSLPVSVVPGLGAALWPVTFVVIQVITNIYYHRAGLYRILGAGRLARY